MKLDLYRKEELRKDIERFLQDVPADQKVTVSKELLEQLLFEEIILNRKRNIVIKLPVWSGEFLQKIDLSQIDFSNVSWAALDYFRNNRNFIKNSNSIAEYLYNLDENRNYCDRTSFVVRLHELKNLERLFVSKVNYNGTNANIDFSKSFESLHQNDIKVMGCSFENCNVYFSKKFRSFYLADSDFSNSRMTLPNNVSDLNVKECNFENCDLSRTTFDITRMLLFGLNLNNLKNTGAKLVFKNYKEIYFIMLKQKLLTGCYLNDTLIENDETEIVLPRK